MRRAILFLILVWASGAAQASDVITPRIDTNVTSGPAPLAVSFNATGTTHSNASINTNRFHELVYLWNYDDPDSGTWATTGKSRNHMSGPLGAHVFEPSSFPDCGGHCKEYNVELTVKDTLKGYVVKPTKITVYNPDDSTNGWGAAGRSICISKTGNFSGCPVAATRETNSGTFNSILSSKIAAGYRRILFRGGETWNWSGSYSLSANGEGLIGAYGTGRAVVNLSTGFVPLYLSGDNWRLQDFEFAGSADRHIVLGSAQVINFLIQRTYAADSSALSGVVCMAIDLLPRGAPDEGIHRNIFIVDNKWSDPDVANAAGSRWLVYGAVWGLNIVGNDMTKGNVLGHTIRITTGQDVLMSNNILGPGHPQMDTLNLRDLPGVCPECPRPFCGRPTKYYLIQDNQILSNSAAGIGQGMQTCMGGAYPASNMASEDFIFERNFFKEAPGGDARSAAINIGYGPSIRFAVRNNILDETGWNWTTGFQGQAGVEFHNNTCYRSDVDGDDKAVCITPAGASECYNNVMFGPNWTGASSTGSIRPHGVAPVQASRTTSTTVPPATSPETRLPPAVHQIPRTLHLARAPN